MGKTNNNSNMGVVMSWSVGLAGIALLLLIMLILFGNLSGSVGFGQEGVLITVVNESGLVNPVHANLTDYTLSGFNTTWGGIVITSVFNSTNAPTGGFNVTVPVGNVSVSTLGILNNATNVEYANISVSYTYTHSFDSIGLANTDAFINNYTQSVLNTGEQFPTVGTIIGVALLLFILIALLVFALVKMAGLGGATGRGGQFS